jgi:D-sedoheptulose 7-phosphate isomerase
MDVIVFTNGCFDIIHPGHIDLLERAKALGTRLIVGINSDDSVRKIKGQDRPFLNERERAAILMGLSVVDEVRIFNEPTPEDLIREIRPDVLVKGGDWPTSEIIGSDLVLQNGGKVFSLPLREGYSSSRIVDKIRGDEASSPEAGIGGSNSITTASLTEHLDVLKAVLDSHSAIIEECAEIITDVFAAGNKVLICGNGGSAADAQHVAAEFVGRYETERRGFPAIALTTDTSALTAVANDYGFERVFARQVESLARDGDCLIAISTSGDSPNVTAAVMAARNLGCKVIGFTGAKGKRLASLCDTCVMVPSARTARIQEAHATIFHIICEMIDRKFADGKL